MNEQAIFTIVRLPADFCRWNDLLTLITGAFAYMDGVVDPPSSACGLTSQSLAEKASVETCFVAMRGDELAGCVFIDERDEHFYIGKLAIAPDCQGRGLGRALMTAVEQHALSRGKQQLELQTRVELTGNQAAFATLGFRETGRTAHPGYSRPTSITMRKVL